jgi:hypothetical protein
VTPDIAESLRDHATVVAGLAAEYVHCYQNPQGYAWEERMHKPHTSTWVEWREQQIEVLEADMKSRVERMHTLTTARVS